ncbi:hypothetical protein [Pedobacter cryotolerans]|uniref:Uncharacterized protein n=1 Tax=Pedobacter cryotolerans TaxID=2571270 RepID=A0A4V5NY85_9SPHI|nr:hypothetical protein [Pedobacter cryotolerans]TKC01223.1 hypothetical protein FA045_08235 [Pedobacter cryotolerans]
MLSNPTYVHDPKIFKAAKLELRRQEWRLNALAPIIPKKPIPTAKTCTKCLEEKHLSEFEANKKVKSGLKAKCKFCYDEYEKAYRAKNRVEINRRYKAWCVANNKKTNNI